MPAKEEGLPPTLSRRLLPFHAAFPSLKERPDGPSGESERPHLPVSGEARAGRGSPGTGLARSRRQLWAQRRAAPSSSLLQPPESPQSPSARRFLILGNFLNAPGQAPHFLPAAAFHRPGTAPPPCAASAQCAACAPSAQGRAAAAGARGNPARGVGLRGGRPEGRRKRSRVGAPCQFPGADGPDKGASYQNRARGQQQEPLATWPACCLILPRTDRHSGARSFAVPLLGKRILFTVRVFPVTNPRRFC